MYKTVKALVLREVKYKESDKILTILTQSDGKMTVKARGALKKGCKYGAASQMLAYSEMTLFGNAGRWSVNEAETIEQFLPLREDIENLALGTYFAEVLEAVSDEDSPNPEMLQLGLNSLFALSRGFYTPQHIKAVFEMRAMCLSGFEPDAFGCAVCGNENPESAMFSINGGIVHCHSCPPGTAGVSLPVCADAQQAIRHIVLSEPKQIFSFEMDEKAEKQLWDIAEAYLIAQLERGFRSLDYWKTIKI